MPIASTLTWLHLSDTHIGNPHYEWDSNTRFASLIDDLGSLQSKFGFRPDLIFFTGDLVYGHIDGEQSMKKQYDEFNKLIERIRNIFDPPIQKKAIHFVPGNHDVNRTKVDDDEKIWLKKQDHHHQISEIVDKGTPQFVRYVERQNEYRKFLVRHKFKHLIQNRKDLSYTRLINVKNLRISITGLNTSWSCCEDDEKATLWLGMPQITRSIAAIKKADIRLLLSHHPPGWLKPNESNLVSRKIEQNFDFHLHGHEHDDWVTQFNNCIRISGGCCYDSPDKPTGYNMVRTVMKDCRSDVFLRTYDEKGGGWIPRIIYRQTSSEGVWSLTNLPFAIKNATKAKRASGDRSLFSAKRKRIDIFKYFTVAKAQDDEQFFVGRKDELSTGIGALMAEGSSIAIYGKAGVGKSSLALQLGYIASGIHTSLIEDHDIPKDGLSFPVIYYCCKAQYDTNISNLFLSVLLDRTLPFSLGDLLSRRKIQTDLKKYENQITNNQLEALFRKGRSDETLSC